MRIGISIQGGALVNQSSGWHCIRRNLLSRPPHRKRSERGRASESEGVWLCDPRVMSSVGRRCVNPPFAAQRCEWVIGFRSKRKKDEQRVPNVWTACPGWRGRPACRAARPAQRPGRCPCACGSREVRLTGIWIVGAGRPPYPDPDWKGFKMEPCWNWKRQGRA